MITSKLLCTARTSFLAHLREFRSFTSQPTSQSPLAFAFDIDGVLCHGHRAIPAAKKALNFLANNNPLNVHIPYVLITNGGGISEQKRASELSKILGHRIHPGQLIQSHTVLKTIVSQYANEPILVLGGKPGIEKIAANYGFKNVHTSYSILDLYPGIWPFSDIDTSGRTREKVVHELGLKVIVVFHDPRDWGRDIQLMLDVLLPAAAECKPVKLIFCNPDMWWKADYPNPRLGQGAFKEAFSGVYKAITGMEYPSMVLGKPSKETFDFAKQVIREKLGELDGLSIYMVGDNILSDIKGANAAGWETMLVRTGVYDPDSEESSELLAKYPARYEVSDVMEAVELAVKTHIY